MTSRGMISARQRVNSYRPDGAIAQHVLASTVEDKGISLPIKVREARQDMQVGRLSIKAGTPLYFVASKFANRYYLVVKVNGGWMCSSLDERVAEFCIAKVQEHRFQASLKKVSDGHKKPDPTHSETHVYEQTIAGYGRAS